VGVNVKVGLSVAVAVGFRVSVLVGFNVGVFVAVAVFINVGVELGKTVLLGRTTTTAFWVLPGTAGRAVFVFLMAASVSWTIVGSIAIGAAPPAGMLKLILPSTIGRRLIISGCVCDMTAAAARIIVKINPPAFNPRIMVMIEPVDNFRLGRELRPYPGLILGERAILSASGIVNALFLYPNLRRFSLYHTGFVVLKPYPEGFTAAL
jgi:hypothetical protein